MGDLNVILHIINEKSSYKKHLTISLNNIQEIISESGGLKKLKLEKLI